MSSHLFDTRQPTFDEDAWHSADSISVASLLSLAETHSREPYFALQIMLRHCESSPLQLIERFMRFFEGVEVRASNHGGGALRLRSKDGRLSTVLVCVPGSHPAVWVLATSAKARTSEFDQLVAPILDRLASSIQAGWISSHELESALVAFQSVSGGQLSPSRVASRGFDRSTIEYLKAASLEQVISELRDSQLLVQSMEFKLHPPDRKVVLLSGAVSRSLRLVYRGGKAHLLERYLLPQFEALLSGHFGHVAIHEHEWSERRIVYKFEGAALMSRENHGRLVDALAEQRRLMVCAFHMNPYLNLAVTDLLDGSSMNLISDKDDEMYVMPGRRCTSGAVSRVLDAVYAGFAAGRVVRLEDGEGDWTRTCGAHQ